MFNSESEMVEIMLDLINQGACPWTPSGVATEFDYSNGRTDVIALLDKDVVVAIEAKLTRWRDALQQAYRNTCFAHWSVVVLPWDAAERAARHRAEFERRRIGLCAVGSDGVVVLIEPRQNQPLLPRLTTRALDALGQVAAA